MRLFSLPGFGSGGNLRVGCGIASMGGKWEVVYISVFTGHVIKTKNQNPSINKIKNPGCD